MAPHAALPILPQYTRGSAEPSRLRQVLTIVVQLILAAAFGFAAVALPPQSLILLIVPTGVCLLFVLWLMPDRATFPLKAITRTYWFYLVLVIAWPAYLAVALPGLPWMTPTRLALFVLTGLFLYSLSSSSVLRHHIWTVMRASQGVWVCFLMWQASAIITIPIAHQVGVAAKIVSNDLLRFAEVLLLGCLLFTRRGIATRTIGTLLFLALALAIDGFVENHLNYPPWANHIPSFMRVDDATLANVLSSQARSADGLYRVRGPYTNSLIFAEFLALCMTFVLHWLLTGRSLLLRVSMAALAVTLIAAILVTHSRLGLVGSMVAVSTYVPLWGYRTWRAKPTAIIGPSMLFGAPLAALALIGLVLSSHSLSTRVFGGGAQAASGEARRQQLRLAIPKVLANPIGHGRGASGNVLGFVSVGGMITVDNHYITTLIDLGVAGAIGFYGMFAFGAWIGVRIFLRSSDRESELAGPLGAMCLVFLVTKTVLSEEYNHSLVILLLSMLLALWARERGLVDPDTGLRQPVRHR